MNKQPEALRLADELDDMGPDHANWSELDAASQELRRLHVAETTMDEYIKGFDAGYGYVLTQIERHPEMTIPELLQYLRGSKEEIEQKRQES